MNFVSSMFASGFSGGGSVATGGSSGLLSGLQGATTLFSALSKIGAGRAESERLEHEAWATERQAKTAEIGSLQRQTEMKRRLLQVLGQNDVVFAGAGIDLSQGVAAEANANADRRANDELSIEREGLRAELGQYGVRARLQRRMARSVRRASYLEAGYTVGSGLIDYLERG